MEQEDRISSFTPGIIATIIGVVADAKEMLSSEVTLAKLELQRELAKTKAAAVTFVIGVGFGLVGAMSLVFMLVHLLATLTVIPLWGCFGIVGSAFALCGALMAGSAKVKSSDVNLLQSSTIKMKKDLAS